MNAHHQTEKEKEKVFNQCTYILKRYFTDWIKTQPRKVENGHSFYGSAR